jgi:hypothetical protein
MVVPTGSTPYLPSLGDWAMEGNPRGRAQNLLLRESLVKASSAFQ